MWLKETGTYLKNTRMCDGSHFGFRTGRWGRRRPGACKRQATRVKILVDNPARLYGFSMPPRRVVQVLLYILLLAMPVSAIIGAWLEGHPLTLGILGSIPPMTPESLAVGKKVSELHTILGDAVVWVAGLHAAAALFHHFMLRDVVLTSMLPRRMRRPR